MRRRLGLLAALSLVFVERGRMREEASLRRAADPIACRIIAPRRPPLWQGRGS